MVNGIGSLNIPLLAEEGVAVAAARLHMLQEQGGAAGGCCCGCCCCCSGCSGTGMGGKVGDGVMGGIGDQGKPGLEGVAESRGLLGA